MTDTHSLATNKKTDLEPFSFSEQHPVTIESHEDQISIIQFWRVLQKRRWLVIGSLAAVVLLVTAVSLVLPKRYDASSRLLLDLEGSQDLGLDQVVMPMGIDLDTKLQTQIRIVQSDTIAVSVIKQLGLHHNPGFVGKQAVPPGNDFDNLDLQTRARLMNGLHRYLTVQLIPKTEIIEIHFRSGDPKLAADVANAVANTYIEHNFQTKYQATLQTSEWLTKQLDDVRKNAEAAQEKVISYQKKTGLLGTDESHNIIIDRLEQLNKALSEAEGDRIVKEAKYRIAMTENPELIANIAPDSLLGALYKQRAESRSEYAQLAAKYGAAYPRVIQLQSQLSELDSSITQEIRKVSETLRAEYRAALKSQEMLQATLEKQKDDAYKMNQDAIQYGIMRREVESSRDLYEGLLKKLKEAGILAGLRSSNINIVDQASVPIEPVEPKIPLNIGLGCMGGLLFGLALAFVVENVDSSIRTPEDIEAYCALPSLGIIPSVAMTRPDRTAEKSLVGTRSPQLILPVTMEHRNSGSAEAFRALRTSLLLSSPGTPPQVILVTSAMMQEGKSFTSLNLAVVLSQTGQKVLLVDSDMRRPAINKYLGISTNRGLSACLAGTEDSAAMIMKIEEIPGLHVMPAGHMPPYPSEMLASEAMPQLVQRWREEFRYIIIDTPPVLAVTDAVVCARIADAVVLVARSEKTGRQSLVRARDLLKKARANIAGVVVNDLSFDSVEYRQYYGYYGKDHQGYYHNGNGNGDGTH
ncbi:MAG TPA: polysaccharide biosynthesis tyrosine autokinase [Terriglobales bacterium]|nr:polysaccharide biosynthesis tyrosine autokinase [Terriglobales bacterium]